MTTIPAVNAPMDLGKARLAIVVGNQVMSIPAAGMYQPLDSDLTAIAALSTTAFGRSLLESVSASALFGAIKQAATTSASGVVTLGTEVRELLTAARTYYVRTDGSDSNNGLANTSGGAFLTIQKAIDVTATLDMSIYDVTIQVGAGTYSQSINVLKQCTGAGHVYIVGDETTPSNVVLDVTGTLGHFSATGVSTLYHLRGMKFTNPSGILVVVNVIGGSYVFFRNLDFGACDTGSTQLRAAQGGVLEAEGNWAISGRASGHIRAIQGGIVSLTGTRTVTITGTPAFSASNGIFRADRAGQITATNMTFSGSLTGKRYAADSNGTIITGGGGASYFPGDVAGTADAATGGVYA